MASRTLRLSGALLLAAAWGPPAAAQSDEVLCLERETISTSLAAAHDERPRAEGLASNGELLEVFASPDGTWTLVLTQASGISCIVASGDGWSQLPAGAITDAES